MLLETSIRKRDPALSRLLVAQHRVLVSATVFVALLVAIATVTPVPISYFEFNFIASGGATQALAAMGQTIVVLTGGFDLSCGAVISLVNVTLANGMDASLPSQAGFSVLGLLIGAATGAFNGFFVGFVRLPSVVVTLSSMFVLHGITLLVSSEAGGAVPPSFTKFFTGSAIPNVLPAALVVIAAALGLWFWVRNTRFGVAIYAVGSDETAAGAAGLSVSWTRFWAYTLAGVFYGAAGVFITAQTGGGDPLVGTPLLLESFAAVVLGGTMLGGGRGGCTGSVLGAYTLLLIVNVLLVLNVPAFYSSIVEGAVLIAAVLAYSLNRNSPLMRRVERTVRQWQSWRMNAPPDRTARAERTPSTVVSSGIDQDSPTASWLKRNAELLRYVLPAWGAFLAALVATAFLFGAGKVVSLHYLNNLLLLSSVLAVLALGQGIVIMGGGFDLSVPWTIALCGILGASLMNGSDAAALWVVPAVLTTGAIIGLVNGLGVTVLGLPPIVVTLAANGILQGIALVATDGQPLGFASPSLHWLMTGRVFGLTPVVGFLVVFVVFASFLLSRTVFGARVLAVGSSPLVAHLSGVPVDRTVVGTYVLSGLCSAAGALLLIGRVGQASLAMGDDFLLPSIAVVVVGGTSISGGRGHYIGMFGGVLLLTALGILLAGTTLPMAVRDLIFGAVMLASVTVLRDRVS
jgi:ribose transport system permease protein